MLLQITYDSSQLYFQSQNIHDFITTMRPVLDWWHYLPNVYIIETSTTTEAEIANQITSRFTGLRFLVTKIDANSPNGVLPKEAWDWFTKKNHKSRDYLPIKKAPELSLQEILSAQKAIKVKETPKIFSNRNKHDAIRKALELARNEKK